MSHSKSSERAEGATYATLSIIPLSHMRLILKPTEDSDTASVTTLILEDTRNGKRYELTTTSSGVSTCGQSGTTSSIKLSNG